MKQVMLFSSFPSTQFSDSLSSLQVIIRLLPSLSYRNLCMLTESPSFLGKLFVLNMHFYHSMFFVMNRALFFFLLLFFLFSIKKL